MAPLSREAPGSLDTLHMPLIFSSWQEWSRLMLGPSLLRLRDIGWPCLF